jgi:hypothetical protein
VLNTIHASQNVQCQNRKHQAQTGCRNDGSHHNEPMASWRPPRTAPRLSDCAQLRSVALRRRALEADFVNLCVGASRQLGEKARSFTGSAYFDISRPNDMTGVTAAGHRNSFAPDCIRHWQATKRQP